MQPVQMMIVQLWSNQDSSILSSKFSRYKWDVIFKVLFLLGHEHEIEIDGAQNGQSEMVKVIALKLSIFIGTTYTLSSRNQLQ